MAEHNRVEARDVETDGDSSHAEDDRPEQELVVPEVFEYIRVGIPRYTNKVSIRKGDITKK